MDKNDITIIMAIALLTFFIMFICLGAKYLQLAEGNPEPRQTINAIGQTQ